MKKFLTSAGLIAVGVSSLQAASSSSLTPIEASKPWSISSELRGFYDDNITTASDHKLNSLGYQLSPSASLNLPLDQTFISLDYRYARIYYEQRPGSKTDQTHNFDGLLEHKFSERYKVAVADTFVDSQEPTIEGSSQAIVTPYRTDGNNLHNFGTIRFTAQVTELLAVELGYGNTFVTYSQDENSSLGYGSFPNTPKEAGQASSAGLLNRIEQTGSIDLRWLALQDTDAILGYQFGDADYNGDEIIDYTNDIHSDAKNSRWHRIYVGADHRFNAQLNGSIRVGGQITDYYNQNDNKTTPYVDSSLTYQYGRGNFIRFGTTHTVAATDEYSIQNNNKNNITVDQQVTAVYISVRHMITPKLAGNLLVNGQRGEFQGGSQDGNVEYYFLPGVNFDYAFNPHISAVAGYNFDRLDSDSGRSYTRNRAYIGVRATY